MAVLGLGISASHAAVLVNLDATSQAPGPLATWPNTGTVAGDFTSLATTPEVITVDGVRGISFLGGTAGNAGTSYLGPATPSSVTGDAARSIEAWIWNPDSIEEKTVISWSRRDGPDGTFNSFGHGHHGTWGAFAGWGYADVGYQSLVLRRWTHIVFTYDPATRTARTYKDGALDNTKVLSGSLNTWATDTAGAPLPFRVARQNQSNGAVAGSGIGTNVIAKIRVHDATLDASAVLAQFDSEKAQFGLVDTDNDGMPTWYELRFGFDPNNAADATADLDNDGATNAQEYQRGTLVNNPDSDSDGLQDGVETGTGTWVSASDRGTNPLNADTDNDKLSDAVESNTGTFVSSSDTGTSPHKRDSDNDTWNDADEVFLNSNPNSSTSFPTAASWALAVNMSAPKYWYRFEELDPTLQATNSGSAAGFQGAYGSGITSTDLGKPSALPSLGNAIEFTGPNAPNTTTKFVDMAATVPAGTTTPNIPELVNLRPASVDKTTTVEYWFKTTHRGTSGNDSWRSPSIIARESPGDGDMYWGKINNVGEFGFSTSDINDILTQRDMAKNVTDGQWHHLVMIKEWHVNQQCVSTMYLDGGPLQPGGASFTRTTAAGNASYQDTDSLIRYIGFTQNGELGNVQYIGFLDEVAIYDRALSEAEVRLHAQAVRNADTDGDGMPDLYELGQSFDPNNAGDAAEDADNDGASNLVEFRANTNPHLGDSDGDGVQDGPETGTGVWVSITDRGTSPLDKDSDNDGLLDNVENNTGTFVDAQSTGTNPNLIDTDRDGFKDGDEVVMTTNPVNAGSRPATPASWNDAVNADSPLHWLSFDERATTEPIIDWGSSGFSTLSFGAGITDSDLGKPSAFPALGTSMEFTAPAMGNSTTKFVDFGQDIPELINRRQDDSGASVPITDGKATTVEYWFKTTMTGSSGTDTWRSPSILAHESGGDGDMYWGVFTAAGDFMFSTSDIHDAQITNGYATDGKWHHVIMSKIWYQNQPSITRLYIDGGALSGGQTIETTTPAGDPSGQDNDAGIRYLGFTQNGEGNNVQYIGLLDEFLVYGTAFIEAQARLHFIAAGGQVPQPTTQITYTWNGTDLVLTWSGGTLQSSDDVTGGWAPVSGATSPYTVPIAGAQKFFRVLAQ